MMNGDKVYVVVRDVPYEFTQVHGVFITEQEAQDCIDDARGKKRWRNDGEFEIQEWLLGERL